MVPKYWQDPAATPVCSAVLAELVTEPQSLTASLDSEIGAFADSFFAVMQASPDVASLIPFAQFALKEELIGNDKPEWIAFVRQAMDGNSDDEILVRLSNVIELLDTQRYDITAPELAAHVIELWKHKISEEIDHNSVTSDYTDPIIEYDRAHDAIVRFVTRSLQAYAIDFDDSEIEGIVEEVDIEKNLLENSSTKWDDEARGRYFGETAKGSIAALIDDLFERDR